MLLLLLLLTMRGKRRRGHTERPRQRRAIRTTLALFPPPGPPFARQPPRSSLFHELGSQIRSFHRISSLKAPSLVLAARPFFASLFLSASCSSSLLGHLPSIRLFLLPLPIHRREKSFYARTDGEAIATECSFTRPEPVRDPRGRRGALICLAVPSFFLLTVCHPSSSPGTSFSSSCTLTLPPRAARGS